MSSTPESALVPRIEKSQMGAIFRVLTEKQDTDTQVFTRDLTIGLRDVVALAASIRSQIENYKEISIVDSANVEFSNNRSKQFSSIEALSGFNWEKPETTASLTLRWNLLLDIPAQEKPAEHNIIVRVACGLKPQDFLRAAFSKQLEDLDSFEINAGGCTCHVTFATQSLASDIFRVVQEWTESRPTPQYLVPYLGFFRRRAELIGKLIARSIPTSTVIALLAFYCMHTRELPQDEPASIGFIRFTLVFGAFMWFATVVAGIGGRWLSSHSTKLLQRIGRLHPFIFTAGDNARQTELAAKNSRSFLRFCFEGAFAIAWNLVAAGLIWFFTVK